MLIDEDVITAHGGVARKYKKGEFIFHEGDMARCYYQIVSGSVKMYNINHDGKEFMQGCLSRVLVLVSHLCLSTRVIRQRPWP